MRKLHILHTNDLHSHFEAMSSVAGCIRQEKRRWEKLGDHVMVVDIGDHTDRARMQTEASWGHANVDVMNATGYQWTTLGNNEGLTFPRERLMHLYDQSRFGVLCSNFIDRETGRIPPFLKPYEIQEVDGFRIGWIGVTASFPAFYELLGWEVEDPVETLEKRVPELRSRADFIIVLSHIGYPGDRRLAERVPGIDLVLGAHTHHVLEKGERVGNTMIAQAGKFGKYVGHIEIPLPGDRKVTADDLKIDLLLAENYEPDHEVSELIRHHLHEAEHEMNQKVADIEVDLPNYLDQESPLGNLLAEGLRKWTDSEIGLVNSGQFLDSLPRGAVQRKEILSILPHPINPCSMYLTGKQIRTILETSLLEENINRTFRGFGFRGKVIGWMCADGIRIHYDPERPPYQRIAEIETDHGPLRDDQKYKVGTIDMFTFGVLFPTFTEGEDLTYFLPEFIRDVLTGQLQNPDAVEQCFRSRWIVSGA
ncbi:MAG: bifunctional metallophosphatase/5'-nucleotidase [Bacillaceae bacterium]|nr:bifunctional metallophosphatase/5'-nucleotidase [Bacillaceae bacterium]